MAATKFSKPIDNEIAELNSKIPIIEYGQAHTPSTGYIGITFNKPFSSTPMVVATYINISGNTDVVSVNTMSISKTGCTFIVNPRREADVQWIAVGV